MFSQSVGTVMLTKTVTSLYFYCLLYTAQTTAGSSDGGCEDVMVEQMLYALDIYNDAARKALYELNSQYLYDEVQAEVNVAYDQLVFQLDSEVYGHYKVSASAATYTRTCLIFITLLL
jgi:Cytoplasmic Fragile-X interacting family